MASLRIFRAHRPTSPAALVLAGGLWLIAHGRARADDDYDPHSTAWNGLATFVAAAGDLGVPIRYATDLALDGVSPHDGLIILNPGTELPMASLARLMREGGRIALADDFGTGTELLDVYRIRRVPADLASSEHLRGNPNLPVARAVVRHTLTDGVRAVVANHPALLTHHELAPLLAFDETPRALVLAGAVGEGRLVAMGDPSMFINNMLQFRGNRRFAGNLLRYLHGEDGGFVYLVTPKTVISGYYGDPDEQRPLGEVRGLLDDMAHARTPKAALSIASLLIATILVLAAIGTLPRRSPYDGRDMFPRPAAAGGFAGRVRYHASRQPSMLGAALVYKFELEGELIDRLGLTGRALLRDVLDALRGHGLSDGNVQQARDLLLELADLRARQDQPPGPPRVSKRRFRFIVQRGEELLANLSGPKRTAGNA